MKKVLLSIVFVLFSIVAFSQTAFAATTPTTKPFLSQTKQMKAWPTDVLVENYSGQSVTVRFITIDSDDTRVVYTYPAVPYYAQLLHEYKVYQVRVMIWDYYGRLFYNEVANGVKRVTLYPPRAEKLTAKDVVISK